jgi:hypothetical protein
LGIEEVGAAGVVGFKVGGLNVGWDGLGSIKN